MNDTKTLRYAELVLNKCSRTYGSAPCTASIGVTGDFKCYNSPRTCQDPANFLGDDEQIIRWAIPTSDLPLEIPCDPRITGISRRPQMLDPGESVGVRESVTVNFANSLHNDALFDNYIGDRAHNPYYKGTYWGKFCARWGSLQGMEFRTVDGYLGQDIDEMDRRYYVVESTDGPDAKSFSITAKDVIKFLDSDKAQAPLPSKGVLLSAITAASTSLTLTPAGVGNLYYPASGTASIGDEKVTFTRSGDVITLTGRGLSGSKLDDHDEGETFQLALVYTGDDPADIIYDLISGYSDTPAEYLDLAEWLTETTTYIGRAYSAEIMKPTPLKTLINELISEVGLIFYTDLRQKKIAIKALRQFVPVANLTDDYIIAGSISSKTLYNKRVSQVWTYYGKRNPLEKQDKKDNYASIYASTTTNSVVALEQSPEAIREVASRWITVFNQPAAAALNTQLLARYETPPRQVSFKIPPLIRVSEGSAVTVKSRIFEDPQGDAEDAFTCQIMQVEQVDEGYKCLAEEVRYAQIPAVGDRIINITEDAFNINIKTIHDSIYTPATSGDVVRVILYSGVKIGSITNSIPALSVGSFASGVIVSIEGDSTNYIAGRGGEPGYGNTSAGTNGGAALYSRFAFEIVGDINIFGGGGGGGGAQYPAFGSYQYGGGGAGYIAGTGASISHGLSGMPWGCAGGNAGANGVAGLTAAGTGGAAIDGVSYATITGSPDIRGSQIN